MRRTKGSLKRRSRPALFEQPVDAIVECRRPQPACAMHLQQRCSYEFLLYSSSTTRQAQLLNYRYSLYATASSYSRLPLHLRRDTEHVTSFGATARSVLVIELGVTSFAHCSNGLFRHEIPKVAAGPMRRCLETPDFWIPNLCAAQPQVLRRRHQAFQLHRTASETH